MLSVAATPAFQEDLLSIFAGAPQVDAKTGAKVSFRNCFFFLLVHRDAAAMERPAKQNGAGTGHTVVVNALGDAMPLDNLRKWLTDDKTTPTHLGLYGILLGLGGSRSDAEILKQAFLGKKKEYSLGVEGAITGFLFLTGADGVQVIEDEILKNTKANVDEVYPVMKGLEIVWTYGADRVAHRGEDAEAEHQEHAEEGASASAELGVAVVTRRVRRARGIPSSRWRRRRPRPRRRRAGS